VRKFTNKLRSNKHKDKETARLFHKCINSRAFKRLDKYRNCALHRRHVYFHEHGLANTLRESSGYVESTTVNFVRVARILCDNPYDIKPKIRQKREIPDFMIDMYEKITNHISKILDMTKKEMKGVN